MRNPSIINKFVNRFDTQTKSVKNKKNSFIPQRITSGSYELKSSSNSSARTLILKNLWFWILTIFSIITLLIIPHISESHFLYLRYFLTFLYIMYLPGCMFIETLYPKREDLKNLERLSLSIGFNIVIVILIGFILNYFLGGIDLVSTIVSLVIFSEIFGAIAFIRKN